MQWGEEEVIQSNAHRSIPQLEQKRSPTGLFAPHDLQEGWGEKPDCGALVDFLVVGEPYAICSIDIS